MGDTRQFQFSNYYGPNKEILNLTLLWNKRTKVRCVPALAFRTLIKIYNVQK